MEFKLTKGMTALALCVLNLILFPDNVQGMNIDGNWSPWSSVKGFCVNPNNPLALVSCGGGVMKRYRSCTNPSPQGAGAVCAGSDTDSTPCNTNPCPLPVEFMWSEWSECSARCGRGQQRRYKMCGGIRKRLPEMTAGHGDNAIRPTEAPVLIPGATAPPAGAAAPAAASSLPGGKTWIDLWELELSSPCVDQPPLEMKENDNQTVRDCNTWKYYGPEQPDLWNHTNCPDPCSIYKCPKFSKCDTKLSTTEDPVLRCTCQMGTVMKSDNSSCIVPPPTTPTPRPIPTLPAATKAVTGAVSRTASTLIIIFLTITIVLFLIFRIFDPHRIIQMCEEISLLAAHICLFPTAYAKPVPVECRVLSILVHYFFTVCFTFMLLEATHMYAMVASVVKQKGLLSTKQNLVVGWGVPAFIVLFNMCFEYENYGAVYHCWLTMDTGLLYGQFVPIVVMVVSTFTLIEAAGASEEYPPLKDCDEVDRTTAKISQRTLLIILPLVFASFVTGALSEYEQQVPLYGTFTILNGVVGGTMFFFHVTCHPKTRALVTKVTSSLCKKKK